MVLPWSTEQVPGQLGMLQRNPDSKHTHTHSPPQKKTHAELVICLLQAFVSPLNHIHIGVPV